MSKLCRVCDKPIVFMSNRAKYCSTICTKIAKQAQSRIQAQNKKLRGIQKLCRRCQQPYNAMEYMDTRHCNSCAKALDMDLFKKRCIYKGCTIEVSPKQKRCDEHQQQHIKEHRMMLNKKLRDETENTQAIVKEKGITKENTGIKPKFLERGTIMYSGYAPSMYTDQKGKK